MVKISAIKKEIILFLEGNINATNSQISNFLGKDDGNISKHLKELRNIDLVVTLRKTEGRVTKNFNSLTQRGMDISRNLKEDKKIEQVVNNSQQVVNNSISLSSQDECDLDNINLRRTHLPTGLDLYLDDTKIQVVLTKENVEFLRKLYKKISNMRIKGDYQDELLKILRGFEFG